MALYAFDGTWNQDKAGTERDTNVLWFANAYTEGYLARLERGEVRASVTTHAVRAAGLAVRRMDDLERGEALTWDVVGDRFLTPSFALQEDAHV